jgi:hypothetical protein
MRQKMYKLKDMLLKGAFESKRLKITDAVVQREMGKFFIWLDSNFI